MDESYRGTSDGSGVYLFAVVELNPDAEEALRADLRRSLPGRVGRFHRRDGKDSVRERPAVILARSIAVSHILFRCHVNRHRQERARQHALCNLVAEMRERGTAEAVFEWPRSHLLLDGQSAEWLLSVAV